MSRHKALRSPDFASSSETPDVAPSFETPEGYVGQAGRLRRAGCPRIRLRGVMEYWSVGVLRQV